MSNIQTHEYELLKGMEKRERRILAKVLSLCESDPGKANILLGKLPKSTAHIVGMTGSPGIGKSTLVNAILNEMSERRVAAIVVDPSSPFTGGALLGDRVRMQSHATSENIFIRSFASRGSLGGLSPSIYEACNAFESFGMNYVIVETVGVGQSEVDIVNVADTVVVVLSPDNGDEIQMMKAGLMEIADMFVINKFDNPKSQILLSRLRAAMAMGRKEIPIYLTNALTSEGVSDLVKALNERFLTISSNGVLKKRRKNRLIHHAQSTLKRELDFLIEKIDLEEEGIDLDGLRRKLIHALCWNHSESRK